jgi:hypothetical protein
MECESIRHRVPRNHNIVRTSEFDSIYSNLDIPIKESYLASRIEGEVTLDILQVLTGFPLEQITRFVYALKAFGAVELRLPESRRSHVARATRPPV